jgi:hypothetical protein
MVWYAKWVSFEPSPECFGIQVQEVSFWALCPWANVYGKFCLNLKWFWQKVIELIRIYTNVNVTDQGLLQFELFNLSNVTTSPQTWKAMSNAICSNLNRFWLETDGFPLTFCLTKQAVTIAMVTCGALRFLTMQCHYYKQDRNCSP